MKRCLNGPVIAGLCYVQAMWSYGFRDIALLIRSV
jgi:hypothetical protein